MSFSPVTTDGKKPYWQTDTPDPCVKTADKTENAVSGDKYDYTDSTKAKLDADTLDKNLHDALGLFVKPPGKAPEAEEAIRFGEALYRDVAAGKKTKQQAALEIGAWVAKKSLGKYISMEGGKDASLAYTMLKAVFMAVPKTLEAQKSTEQLYHDEGVRLVIAEHFKDRMPGVTYAGVEKGMSTFGRTFRKTDTFATQVAAFEGATKAQPSLAKAMDDRFWLGKCAAMELAMKSKGDLEHALDPANMDPRAVAFRKCWNDPSNVAFRLGVTALIDEASLGSEEANALYEKDLAEFHDMKAKVALLPSIPIKF